jgi:uncharacterized repeat protein (TIGR01451 family)
MPTKPPGTPDLDLTDPNTFGIINDAVFMTGNFQPAGTGNFDTFLRLQNNGSEQGYNNDASPQYDEKDAHTHSILLAEVPIVIGDGANGTIEGLAYREFRLDLSEPNGGIKPYISLDKLQIWQQEAGNLTNFTPGTGFAGAHTNYLAYDLDAGGDRWIALDAGMSSGSGQSDYRILIPDSFFINDAEHRYVTLFSEFGKQPGWESAGGFEEWGTSGPNGGAVSAIAVDKTATVAGGTADQAGEVISYTIKVANVGNQALTGVTVSDPFVSNLAAVLSGGFNVGDLNHDGTLSAGETWQYSASYTVTQFDIDNLGTSGDGTITNTVTADTDQTGAVSDTTSVEVERQQNVLMSKAADVGTVDAAGDVINYTINVQNTGTTTLPGPLVNDPHLAVFTPILAPILSNQGILIDRLDGDYNVGDTNENGIQDPGETFEYRILGDENDNGIEDPGETFVFANVGDTNRNGLSDPGETWQFANAGDTNQNGIEDPGETFQFNVNDQVAGVDADHDGFNDGDLNEDGALNVGETWQFAGSYTVTQDDIDNGGVFNPSLSLDNTATATAGAAVAQASASVAVDQNPHLAVAKDASVPGGTADAAGEVISYTIAVTNDGNMTLTDVDVDDPSVTNLAAVISAGFNIGDLDHDGKLDLGETWQYTASHTVTQAEMDAGGSIANSASATTGQGATASDGASVTVAQNPQLVIDKSGVWDDGPEANGYADAGEQVHYTFSVTNTGNVSLDNVAVSDPLLGGPLGGPDSGDTANIGILDVGETWVYSADYVITAADVAAGTVHNTATASAEGPQDQPAGDSDSDDVALPQAPAPALTFTKEGFFVDTDENGVANVGGGDLVQYIFRISNTGNVVLSNIAVTDSLLGGPLSNPDGDNGNGVLDVGESWSYDEFYLITQDDVDAGTVHNEATATALDPSNQAVNAAALADTLLPA